MKYTIIDSDDFDVLTERVNEMIKDGWKPQGGVATNYSDQYDSAEYLQAMIKIT